MSAYGEMISVDAIAFTRHLPGPLERVWAYLTDSELRGRWLASGPMAPHPGGRVDLRFRHADLSPETAPIPPQYAGYADGAQFTGEVTVWAPPSKLAYTWGEPDDSVSEVTFELAEEDGQVRLTLTHRRLRGRDMILSVASGWHTHLDILSANLAGAVPKPFWPACAAWEAAYAQRLDGNPAE